MNSVSASVRFVRFPESVPEIENITVMMRIGMQAKIHIVKVLQAD
ncbi:MAG TPA: hypothetical protein VKQ11_21865 [Candidatus Sulfotelmatobacter sp.]|nr:hypothetical protein [Candidatus Sulfotelmatobacter sp.]